MGSLAGHISAFLFLFPIGIRRLSSTLTLFLRSPPSSFLSRPWYFSDHPNPQLRLLRNADLYALLLSLPIAVFSHLFLFLSLHRFPFALHSALLSLFFLLLLLHSTSSSLIPDDLIFLLAALTFLAEYGLSDNAAGGVDGRVHQLTSAVTLACAAACGALAVWKSAVAADVALAMGLAMKGTWALQEGVTLYAMPPRGCRRGEGWGVLECELEEDRMRGLAVVELMFAAHAVVIAVGCVGMYWAVARKENPRADFEAMMMTRPIMSAELEME